MSARKKYKKALKKTEKLEKKLRKQRRRHRREVRQLNNDAVCYMDAVVEQVHQHHRENNADWQFVRWARGHVGTLGIVTGILVVLAMICAVYAWWGPKVTAVGIAAAIIVFIVVQRAMKLANPYNHEGQA